MTKRDDTIFWVVIGTIVLVSALTGLGTEAGLLALDFPFWPTIFVWVGISIVVSAIRKLRNPEQNLDVNNESWC